MHTNDNIIVIVSVLEVGGRVIMLIILIMLILLILIMFAIVPILPRIARWDSLWLGNRWWGPLLAPIWSI